MWLFLLLLLVWALWATASASSAATKVQFLTSEVEQLRKSLTERQEPPDEDEVAKALAAKLQAFKEANAELFTSAWEVAKKAVQESDARLSDAEVVDTIQLTRNEIRELYHALESSSDVLDTAFRKRLIRETEHFSRAHWPGLLEQTMALRVRAHQHSDLAYKIRREAEERWAKEA